MINRIRGFAVISISVILVACGGSTSDGGDAQTPLPAVDIPEKVEAPQGVPEPVELLAELIVSDEGVMLVGLTNLPDGAAVLYEINAGRDDYDAMSAEQRQLYLAGQEGFAIVASGRFDTVIEGWSDVPICSRKATDESDTDIFVYFVPVKHYNDGAFGIYGAGYVQPESIYQLYGFAGENLEAVSPAQVSESPSHEGKELQVAGTCAADVGPESN